jgi:hypothetical protein
MSQFGAWTQSGGFFPLYRREDYDCVVVDLEFFERIEHMPKRGSPPSIVLSP